MGKLWNYFSCKNKKIWDINSDRPDSEVANIDNYFILPKG